MLTVVTPAASQRLASPAALQARVPGLSAEEAGRLLDEASALIARHCERVFVEETVRETFRFQDYRTPLILARWPVSAVVSVVQYGRTLDVAEYEVHAASGWLERLCNDEPTPWLGPKVEVEYTAGYAANAIPADLAAACVTLAAARREAEGRDPTVRSVQVPDVESVSYFDPGDGGGVLPEAVRKPIEPYRRVSV